LANKSVEFFEDQFRRQVAGAAYELNPFEELALPWLCGGEVLDLGCGLGNLALDAAARGATVTAVDASLTAIARIRHEATVHNLDVHAYEVDLADFVIEGEFDAVVSIGLLMFFERELAEAMLAEIRDAVGPGGVAIINVLTAGTTYMDMFEPGHYTLFAQGEIEAHFTDWEILLAQYDRFPAPGGTEKCFLTLVARKAA
jgi:tellurite methyltransferase